MLEKELKYQLNDAEAGTIITLDLFYPTVEKVVPKTKIKNVIVASIPDIFPPLLTAIRPPLVKKGIPGTLDFNALVKSHEPKPPEVKIEPKMAKKGVMHIALQSGIPMLPFRFQTARVIQLKTWDRKKWPLPFCTIRVQYLEPIRVTNDKFDEAYDELTKALG